MNKRKWLDWLDDCPGLYYGNNPHPEYGFKGNVTVATKAIVPAIDWLRRRRATIIQTNPGQQFGAGPGDHGIAIQFQLRQP